MPTVQRYAKTPKAWDALPRPALLGRQAHTLLLMANGRRSLRELSLLMGENVESLAQDLSQAGYLQTAALVIGEDGEPPVAA